MTFEEFISRRSHKTANPHPVAVFDCDGTVIRGDIGEAMLYYQIDEFLFRRSPADVWTTHPRRVELDRLFDSASRVPPGERPDHPEYRRFADEILDWYFLQLATERIEDIAAGCADIVRLCAGFTLQEIRDIAERNLLNELSIQPGPRPLGTHRPNRGVRFLRQAREMVRTLLNEGFEVWAVSGSNRWSVEPVFRGLGVPAERVIGIDLAVENSLLTPNIVNPIPVHTGKVRALQKADIPRPVFVASDSPLDVPLLEYSRDAKVYMNTRYPSSEQFFAESGVSRDETWITIDHPLEEECPTHP